MADISDCQIRCRDGNTVYPQKAGSGMKVLATVTMRRPFMISGGGDCNHLGARLSIAKLMLQRVACGGTELMRLGPWHPRILGS